MDKKELLEIIKLQMELKSLKQPAWKKPSTLISALTVIVALTAVVLQYIHSDNKLTLARIHEAEVRDSVRVYTDSLIMMLDKVKEADSLLKLSRPTVPPEVQNKIDEWRFPIGESTWVCSDDESKKYSNQPST